LEAYHPIISTATLGQHLKQRAANMMKNTELFEAAKTEIFGRRFRIFFPLRNCNG